MCYLILGSLYLGVTQPFQASTNCDKREVTQTPNGSFGLSNKGVQDGPKI